MYLTFETLKNMTEGKEFPFFFMTQIKTYYENGEVVEVYKRSV